MISENARRDENNLIISYVNEDDLGKYECIDINKEVYHFEIFLLESTTQVIDEELPEVTDEQEGAEVTDEQVPEVTYEVVDDVNYVKEEEIAYKRIVAQPKSEIKLDCSIAPDQKIQWIRKNGVKQNFD